MKAYKTTFFWFQVVLYFMGEVFQNLYSYMLHLKTINIFNAYTDAVKAIISLPPAFSLMAITMSGG
jgi:hypothetical protein